MFRSLTALVLAGSLALAPVANACTGIKLTAKDGTEVAGRTLEFGTLVDWYVTAVPSGTQIKPELPADSGGLTYETKYGITGMTAYDTTNFVDAINEEGLYVGLFYFPGYASYPDLGDDNRAKALAPQQYATWLLANFATIDEVKAHFDDIVLVAAEFEQMGEVIPMHVRVVDKTGNAIVIEPTDKTLKIFDAPLGVITNSPTYDWHMTNLSNFVNLSTVNVPPVKLDGVELQAAGQGAGMHGLPGDFTPPSRFVRAAVFSQSAIPVETGAEVLEQAFHILNNFDIPYGAVRGEESGKVAPDYTQWTAVADLTNGTWTVKTYDAQNLRVVDVKAALAAADGKVVHIDSKKWSQSFEDISSEFK
ncbi:choloylglycine hydrolase family protein [Microbaculum marinisediminis]|uniref:Choloylglycine hydrolase family protein n=1 Tax=Microbaculum marinisediminis TaxID=2931392 RepID=A0AAW5QZH3_9HYPH|nr:choloylglycine hydrolase family protein [Microbaculum sp. A6E488]MCT8971818.1 choloylglycine hydrolase family protein [Microbaculum sp. A6E488]